MQKLVSYMVAWIPSRWVDEHKTVLYKQREPVNPGCVHLATQLQHCLTREGQSAGESNTERERERTLFELQNLINIKIIK